MGRACLLSLAAALLIVGGCAAPMRGGSLAFLDRRQADANPFRRTAAESRMRAAKAEPSVPGTDEGDVQLTAGEAPATRGGGHSRDVHDAATLRMIEEELKDASPQERDQLLADLRGLQPAMVRQILKIRRMVRQMGQDAPGRETVAASGEQAGNPFTEPGSQDATTVRQVSGTEASLSQEPAFAPERADAGLGSVDPWGDRRSGAVQTPAAWGDGRRSFDGPGPTADTPASPDAASYPWKAPATGGHEASRVAIPNQPASYGHSTQHNAAAGQPQPAGSGVPGHAGTHSAPAVRPLGQPQFQNASYGTRFTPAGVPSAAGGANQPGAAPEMEPYLPRGATGSLQAYPQGQAMVAKPAIEAGPFIGGNTAAADDPQLEQTMPPAWDQDIQQLVAKVEAGVATLRLGDRPTDIEKRNYIESHVYLRMLYLMAGQEERALTAIPGIDAADQEFWQQVMWSVANYFDAEAIPDAGDRASQTIAQLRSAIQRLQENARLDLRNVAFCHKISSFGTYERFDRDEFSPGQPVLLYAEVGNFKSEPAADGQFRTVLKSTVEIYRSGPNGELVERMAFPTPEDLCRNYRKDFFLSYEFTVPQRISLGPYVLKLIVEDQLSQKVATYTLNFMVR